MLDTRVSVPYAAAVAALVALTGAAFAASYADLAPLAGSDSPESVLLVIPVVAVVLLWRSLMGATRHGNEAGVNAVFAIPLLVALVALLLWLPVKLSYFYWVYRLDLLAVPMFVALGILMLFGVPAMWTARRSLLLLVVGWPPLLDVIVRAITPPLARAQAAVAALIVAPFTSHVTRVGDSFVLHRGQGTFEALTVGTACAGLVGLLSMALVAGVVASLVRGRRSRKLLWLLTALALALLANVGRLAALVAVADGSGIRSIEGIFHATAGVILFAGFVVVSLLLLHPFGLRLPDVRLSRTPPLPFRLRGLIGVTVLLLVTTAAAAWATTGLGFDHPGLFARVPALSATQLVAKPTGYRIASSEELLSTETVYGGGAQAWVYHLVDAGGHGVAAQVIVTRSYYSARSYGVLDCFTVHDYNVLAVHREALPGGGNLSLIALRIDGRDVATANWLQPVTLDGVRAWRRTVLYRYLDRNGANAPAYRPSGSRSLGLWLLDALSPYGGQHPPKRFDAAERTLTALAGVLAERGVVPRVGSAA